MNKISIIQGDLFSSDAKIIAHQCNCQGMMESGVAKQVKERYPSAYDAYKTACDNRGEDMLGAIQFCPADGRLICNMFGQASYGYDGKQYTDLLALKRCFAQLAGVAKSGSYKIAMPYKIGCVRGGANWENDVFPAIQEIFKDVELELYQLDLG